MMYLYVECDDLDQKITLLLYVYLHVHVKGHQGPTGLGIWTSSHVKMHVNYICTHYYLPGIDEVTILST